ncbi:MAG: type III pantothenate kinase [Cyclobacteriaceae bacterium]
MFLSIDAGNSNVVFGFFDDQLKEWIKILRIDTKKSFNLLALEKTLGLFYLENEMSSHEVHQIGFSTVVPELERTIFQLCQNFFDQDPYVINGRSYQKLSIHTQNPYEIGSDLMANMAAAYQKYQQACIIVDFGTALTFSTLDKSGIVISVNIVPGIKTALHSLFSNTAKLPKVKMEMPPSVLGKNTVESIQTGIFYGYSGLVKGVLQAIKEETKTEYKVIATGGMSTLLSHLKDSFNLIDEKLTLEGIKLITTINTGVK